MSLIKSKQKLWFTLSDCNFLMVLILINVFLFFMYFGRNKSLIIHEHHTLLGFFLLLKHSFYFSKIIDFLIVSLYY